MDLEVVGRHALLFDDDPQSAFVNSPSALVPWNDDRSLLIDRYDVRHLLPSIPKHLNRVYVELELGDVKRSELDGERYHDLPKEVPGSEGISKGEDVGSGMYQAVPFSYCDSEDFMTASNSKEEIAPECSGYRPPFPLPKHLLHCLPPTEKLHQIIARTALHVSKHGGQSEIVLRVKLGDNPTFGFLMPAHDLHPYYRYLVEHSNFLGDENGVSGARDGKNPSKIGGHRSEHAGGALSLLGSVYGSLDDDEIVNHEPVDSKGGDISDLVNDEQSQKPTKTASNDPVCSETKSLLHPKESLQPLRKNPPVVLSTSISINSKPKVQTNTVDNSSKSQSFGNEIEKLIVEPPSALKEAVSKIVEFILRNGREFEAVLIEQDRPHGRFPFLLPTNLYHSYYLKVLHEAQEGKRLGKKPRDWKPDSSRKIDSRGKSREPDESASLSSASYSEGFYDPERKEKFKMVIGVPKKEMPESNAKPSKESGVSVDMAAAIVMAATRGLSSPTRIQTTAKAPCISTETAAAIVMAATRGSVSPPKSHGPMITVRDSISILAPGQSHHSSSLGGLSLHSGSISLSGLIPSSCPGTSVPAINGCTDGKDIGSADSVKVANAIARNVALAAASEADSSEASLTKEQKLKAERLKRAKLFTSMISSSMQNAGKLLPLALGQTAPQETMSGSAFSGSVSNLCRMEREGSSMPGDVEASGRSEKKDTLIGSKHSSREKKLRPHVDNVDLKESQHSPRKKHKSETSRSDREEQRHRRHYRSSKTSIHESSSEDELTHKKRSGHHHRHSNSSDDEHRKRSHRHRSRNSHSDRGKESKKVAMEKISEYPDSITSKVPCITGEGSASPNISGSQSHLSEVSDDLRAKVRAMLLATL